MVFRVLVLLATWWVQVGSFPAGRDFGEMERRRRRAARLFARGATRAEVARELRVSRQSVSRWYADWQAGGTAALKAAGRAGRMPRLTPARLRGVERALRKGPRAHGFGTDVWTLDRVAVVIEAQTGVRYHRGTCGSCCGTSWAGAANGRHGGRSSATMRRSRAGWPRTGRA